MMNGGSVFPISWQDKCRHYCADSKSMAPYKMVEKFAYIPVTSTCLGLWMFIRRLWRPRICFVPPTKEGTFGKVFCLEKRHQKIMYLSGEHIIYILIVFSLISCMVFVPSFLRHGRSRKCTVLCRLLYLLFPRSYYHVKAPLGSYQCRMLLFLEVDFLHVWMIFLAPKISKQQTSPSMAVLRRFWPVKWWNSPRLFSFGRDDLQNLLSLIELFDYHFATSI